MPSEGDCIRKMVTAHGGEWNATYPYDSLPAFMVAYDDGADAVKGGRCLSSYRVYVSSSILFMYCIYISSNAC
jgi:hypothetical protein